MRNYNVLAAFLLLLGILFMGFVFYEIRSYVLEFNEQLKMYHLYEIPAKHSPIGQP